MSSFISIITIYHPERELNAKAPQYYADCRIDQHNMYIHANWMSKKTTT